MDIKTPETFKKISYGDASFSELEEHLKDAANKTTHHLCLFLGLYQPDKKKARKQLASSLNREIKVMDMEALVSKVESETFEKLDQLFATLDQADDILYFKNGDKLCGTYTSYTSSLIKYATPQERYFLKKVKAFKGLVILDIDEFAFADKTLRRAAHSVVSFTLPNSIFKRFFWHLKNYSTNGSELRTDRPDAYNDSEINA